ncbi:MAG: hypothetical protein AB1716_10550 [Planctomycetota bacterium]
MRHIPGPEHRPSQPRPSCPLGSRRRSAAGILILGLCVTAAAQVPGDIEPIQPSARGFYAKKLVIRGIPVMGHADVSDAALEEAARRVDHLLANMPAVTANLQRARCEVHVIGKDQQTTDLPEFRHVRGKPFEGKLTLDQRARGFSSLYTSCSEENLLLLPSDRWPDHRDILTHEFAHTILIVGCSQDIRDRVEAQRKASAAAGLWPGCYAATNLHEFFAELTMWYFGSRGDYGRITPPPTRGALWLRRYDPDAYRLVDDIYSGRLKPAPREFMPLASVIPPQARAAASAPARAVPTSGAAAVAARAAAAPPPRAGVSSESGGAATEILFFNQTDRPVKLFLLAPDGRRQSFGEVPIIDVVGQTAHVGEAWLVEHEDGRTLGVFVAGPKIGWAVITDGPTDERGSAAGSVAADAGSVAVGASMPADADSMPVGAHSVAAGAGSMATGAVAADTGPVAASQPK